MEGEERLNGFIVHSYLRSLRKGSQLCLVGRLSNLESFAVIVSEVRHRLFVRASAADRARRFITSGGDTATLTPSHYQTMDGEACLCLSTPSAAAFAAISRALTRAGVRSYEADLRPTEAFLMDRGIHASMSIRGPWRKGERVARVYVDPEIAPAEWTAMLSVASIDIETNPHGPEIYAMALHFASPSGRETEEVLLFHPPHPGESERTQPDRGKSDGGSPPILRFNSERAMLEAWCERIVELDPDIITGWNVIDFDLARIVSRLADLRLPFRVGRSGEPGSFLSGAGRKPATIIIPGRQALDAMRLMRSGPQRFADQTLETAAQEILGRGKAIRSLSKREKLEEIERMYREDEEALCGYSLEDARLVAQILAKTGLLDLTLRRSMLIGVPLARAWTSIAAFDFIYIEAMHRRSIVAPTLGVDRLPLTEAPGGAIIDPASGLFDNVLVFDFKSLYPSIIRTFNIDPLSFRGRSPEGREGGRTDGEPIVAPNGARFSREPAILPELLERFFAGREEAKRRKDGVAAYVYKIILNSFYGVLGASGCRFAGSDLAGAITSFGHEILFWCRDLLAARGYETLYGDTDSLFVRSGLREGASLGELERMGKTICAEVNHSLSAHVEELYRVPSRLELQFEKVYAKFFIPPLRGASVSEKESGGGSRGRSKGYAGYLIEAERDPSGAGNARQGRVDIRGMEAVRRDWTEAARELQVRLLRMLFEGRPSAEIESFIRDYVRRLRSGLLDSKLVYTKALRKSVGEYTRAQPPHVQAARYLAIEEQAGLINFLWTTRGPQPTIAVTAPIDYDHYLQKQIRPIVASLSDVLGRELEEIVVGGGQLNLF